MILLIGNLDPNLVALLAALQPKSVWVELEPTVERNPAGPPND
jgi:hypothetical protein